MSSSTASSSRKTSSSGSLRGAAAWVDVDLGAIRANARAAIRHAGGARLLAVVKEDAYGHGAPAVARALRGIAAGFAVATVAEGEELRRAGVREPVLVLTPPAGDEWRTLARAGLTPTVGTVPDLYRIPAGAGGRACVQIKFDTGMGRFGFAPRDAADVAARLRARGIRRVAGVYTHLAAADESPFTGAQLARFEAALRALRGGGIDPGWVHAANSEAVVDHPRACGYGTVRPGLLLYGVSPSGRAPFPLAPAMAFRARVAAVRALPKGATTGYGHTWTSRAPVRLATLAVGYAGGYSRRWSGRGRVLVRGVEAPVRGRVSMNLTVVDVSRIRGVAAGDRATLFGRDGRAELSVGAYAAALGTIAYEPLCVAGSLNPRRYRRGRA